MSVDEARETLWYVKRGQQINGPFPAAMIRNNVALGRIRGEDLVSADGRRWYRADKGWTGIASTVEKGTACDDERRSERRASTAPDVSLSGEQRCGDDRRKRESREVIERRARSERVWASLKSRTPGLRKPMLALGLILSFVTTLSLVSVPEKKRVADCSQPAAANANWDFCNLAGGSFANQDMRNLSGRNANLASGTFSNADMANSDLAYADLNHADLTLSQLSGARLVGANLRNARLNHARLDGADLRFADLTNAEIAGLELAGADLFNAIWVNGRICRRHSVGACVQ